MDRKQAHTLAADINPVGSGDPQFLTVSENILFFQGNNGSSGHELWKLDMTNAVNDLAFEDQFAVYPNPVSDIVNIRPTNDLGDRVP